MVRTVLGIPLSLPRKDPDDEVNWSIVPMGTLCLRCACRNDLGDVLEAMPAGRIPPWLHRWRGLCLCRSRMLSGQAERYLWRRQAVHTIQVWVSCLALCCSLNQFHKLCDKERLPQHPPSPKFASRLEDVSALISAAFISGAQSVSTGAVESTCRDISSVAC